MPNKYMPVNKGASMDEAIAQFNRNFSKIDSEVTTKQFKDRTGNTMTIGNIQDGRFGTLMLDADGNGIFDGLYQANRFGRIKYSAGVPVALDGMAPDDGRIGFWESANGEDVLELLGG